MADQQEDKLLEHEYDGIREYDNPMPRWWLWTFYATIIFVPLYYVLPLPFGEGPGMIAEYEADVARAAAAAPPPDAGGMLSDEEYEENARNPAILAEGAAVYTQYCAVCHAADGSGGIGASFTDDVWIHGREPSRIHATIVDGVLAKGMPPWGRILRPAQVDAVTAYVISLAP